MVDPGIPTEYIDALETIVNINDDIYSRLVNSLEEYDCTNREQLADLQTLTNYLKSIISSTEVSEEKLSNLLNFLLSSYTGLELHGFSAGDIIEAITNDLSDLFETESFYNKKQVLRDRLTKLLGSIKILQITAKGYDLMAEYDKVFIGSRIITDIRPIFPSLDASVSSVASAIIVHNLKITYQKGKSRKDIFVAMDSNDIKQLRSELDRAETKSNSVRNIIKFTKEEKKI